MVFRRFMPHVARSSFGRARERVESITRLYLPSVRGVPEPQRFVRQDRAFEHTPFLAGEAWITTLKTNIFFHHRFRLPHVVPAHGVRVAPARTNTLTRNFQRCTHRLLPIFLPSYFFMEISLWRQPRRALAARRESAAEKLTLLCCGCATTASSRRT